MIQIVQTSAGPIQLIPQAVLEQPDLNIFKARSMTLVVGPNGAGKTRMLASMIKTVLESDGGGRNRTDHSDTLVVYYSPVPCNSALPSRTDRFINLQNGMYPKRGHKEPNLNVLKNLAPDFGVKADVLVRFFATNAVFKEVHSLLLGRSKPVADTLSLQLREAIGHFDEKRVASEQSRRALGIIAHIGSAASAAEDEARVALSNAIEQFLKSLMGNGYRRNILAASYTIDKHNKPTDFIRWLLQKHGVKFSKPVGKLTAAQSSYAQATDELTKIGTVLGDKDLTKSEYVLNEAQVTAIAELNHKKYSSIFLDGLSSGGTALLTQFTSIEESIKQKISTGGTFKHLLLLIDEGDIFLHTAWQQKYVDYLNRFVERIHRDWFQDIQLVLTTHSPVLMSDFPRDCIVKLDVKMDSTDDPLNDTPINLRDRDDKALSFGAPLSSIINTTGEAGTMGAFALQHIEGVLASLQAGEPVAQYHIDIIDDPLVKKYISNLQSGRG
jgi:energy-coupling factor transporter ATP-binding protein EcfA2